MSCPHCHNEKIRTGERLVDFNDIAQEILASRRYVSALVISGGEPVMQPEVCLELLIWGHALGLKVGLETSGCRPIPEGFDRVFLDIKTSLESWLYNSYTGDNKAFDNVVQNLERLDPKTTEIRYVVHEEDPPIIDPLSPSNRNRLFHQTAKRRPDKPGLLHQLSELRNLRPKPKT